MADHASCVTEGEQFGVGCGVTCQLTFVVPSSDDTAATHNDSAHRDIIVFERSLRLVDCQLHRDDVNRLERCGSHGGGRGIRTLGRLPFTRFPSVPIRPLSHPSRVGRDQ